MDYFEKTSYISACMIVPIKPLYRQSNYKRFLFCSKIRSPLCPVSPSLLASLESSSSPSEDLKNCFDDNCDGKVGEEDCYGLRSCTWCVFSKSKSIRLEKPFCISSELCYGGVQGSYMSFKMAFAWLYCALWVFTRKKIHEKHETITISRIILVYYCKCCNLIGYIFYSLSIHH